jgi:hypothetical protein
MRIRPLLLILAFTFLYSCSETYNCPAFTQDELSRYIGSFVSYSAQISFTSQSGDSLGFNLETNFSDPYTCTKEANDKKDCECRASKTLRDDLPNGATHNFNLSYYTENIAARQQNRYVDVYIDINNVRAGFLIFQNDGDNRLEVKGTGAFFNDTTINNQTYANVLVTSNYPTNSTTQMIFSETEGLLGFKDENGVYWYRNF